MTEYAAIDFGASSGRVVCGTFDGRVMALEPCHRFANQPVRLPDGLRWNLLHLFTEAVGALRGRKLDGVGVDTWGVDYALLDEHDRVLGLPFHYRDARTEGAANVDGYAITGIQDMPINTVYQLLAEGDSAALREAHSIALVPDLLALWLSGELANERTNASTTALLDARTGEFLGAHMVGNRACDMIAELVATMAIEGGYQELERVVHPHPTASEAILDAARAVDGWAIHA